MTRWLLVLLTLLVAHVSTGVAEAHEVRPAYLEISERSDGRADILWKQPTTGQFAVALRPKIDRLIDRQPDELKSTGSFSIASWRNLDLAGAGLNGRAVRVDGLDRTITDVLIFVRLRNGDTIQQILTPSSPDMVIDTHAGAAVGAYLRLGIEHILTGVDHLLFVFGLILLSRSFAGLLKTVTAFTVAHSITLALTALRLIAINPQFVEAMVAFSILFLAVELVRKQRGQNGLAQRWPWIIAFGFGLLHGAAFAGALKEIGLPAGNIPGALFLFNMGVEIGQILFVLAVTALFWVVRQVRLPAAAPAFANMGAAYVIGIFSMFWFLERLTLAVTILV